MVSESKKSVIKSPRTKVRKQLIIPAEKVELESKSEGREVKIPISKTKSPVGKTKSPISRAKSPISRVKSPISRAKSPISRAKSPISRAKSPISRAKSPISRAKSPISRAKSSISRAKSPISRAKSPISRAKSPTSRDKSPTSRDKSPISRAKSPISRAKNPVGKVKSPISRDKSSTIRDKSPTIRDKSPTIRDKSPTTRDKSPISRDKSSTIRDKSPTIRDKSPTIRDKSPTTRDKSPTTRDKSPTTRDKSPTTRDKSPTTRDKSPTTRDKSPTTRDKSLIAKSETQREKISKLEDKTNIPIQTPENLEQNRFVESNTQEITNDSVKNLPVQNVDNINKIDKVNNVDEEYKIRAERIKKRNELNFEKYKKFINDKELIYDLESIQFEFDDVEELKNYLKDNELSYVLNFDSFYIFLCHYEGEIIPFSLRFVSKTLFFTLLDPSAEINGDRTSIKKVNCVTANIVNFNFEKETEKIISLNFTGIGRYNLEDKYYQYIKNISKGYYCESSQNEIEFSDKCKLYYVGKNLEWMVKLNMQIMKSIGCKFVQALDNSLINGQSIFYDRFTKGLLPLSIYDKYGYTCAYDVDSLYKCIKDVDIKFIIDELNIPKNNLYFKGDKIILKDFLKYANEFANDINDKNANKKIMDSIFYSEQKQKYNYYNFDNFRIYAKLRDENYKFEANKSISNTTELKDAFNKILENLDEIAKQNYTRIYLKIIYDAICHLNIVHFRPL